MLRAQCRRGGAYPQGARSADRARSTDRARGRWPRCAASTRWWASAEPNAGGLALDARAPRRPCEKRAIPASRICPSAFVVAEVRRPKSVLAPHVRPESSTTDLVADDSQRAVMRSLAWPHVRMKIAITSQRSRRVFAGWVRPLIAALRATRAGDRGARCLCVPDDYSTGREADVHHHGSFRDVARLSHRATFVRFALGRPPGRHCLRQRRSRAQYLGGDLLPCGARPRAARAADRDGRISFRGNATRQDVRARLRRRCCESARSARRPGASPRERIRARRQPRDRRCARRSGG